jgi:hypothetical protein
MIHGAEALPEVIFGGEVPLARVREATADQDVDLGLLTDEALHWARPDPMAPPKDDFDAPRLRTYPQQAQDAALEAVLQLLHARGEAAWDPDRQELLFVGPLAFIAGMRSDPRMSLPLDVHLPEGARLRAVVREVTDDVYLTEVVDSLAGAHHFVLRNRASQADWLAEVADPLGLAGSTGAPTTADDPTQLHPSSSQLSAWARTVCLLFPAYRGEPGEQPGARNPIIYATDEGLYVVEPYLSQESSIRWQSQTLSPRDLVRYCTDLLTTPPAQ